MDTIIGTAQVTRPTSGTSSATGKTFIGRWVSELLGSTTQIDANTWTVNFAATDAGSNKFPATGASGTIWVCAYVWRPGTGKVGSNIIDGVSSTGFQVGTTTEKVEHGTFTGAVVTGVQNTDVLCIELWADTSGAGSGWAYRVYFDGTTVNTTAAATVSDQAAFIETPQNITLPLHLTQSLTETISVSDSQTTLNAKTRLAPTEIVSITDNLLGYYARPLERIVASSSVAITVGHPSGGNNVVRTLTQTITISSTVARLTAKIRPLTETITILSTVARAKSLFRTLTETVTTTPSTLTRIKGTAKSLTETVAISSTVARIKGAVKALTQTITISDVITKALNKFRTLSQTVTISDNLAILRNKIRTITTTITISSTPVRLATKLRPLATQTVTISDTIAKSKGAVKALTETVTISSTLTRLVSKIRNITETIAISSIVTRLSTKLRPLATETITISSTVARVLGARAITKTLTETVTISTASLALLRNKIRTLTETIAISSTAARLTTKLRPLAIETIIISSTVAKIKGSVKALTETITIVSIVARLAAKIRTITTTITITDAVTRAKAGAQNIVRTLTETVTITSTVTRAQTKIRMLTEVILLSPSTVARIASKIRAPIPESITIGTGVATKLRGLVRTSTGSISAISTLTRLAQKIRQIQETITIQDQLIGQGPTVAAKAPPRPSISILAQELKHITTVSKDLQRFLFETVHISDFPKIHVKRYSKIIRTARVKKMVRILDLVKIIDDTYNRSK